MQGLFPHSIPLVRMAAINASMNGGPEQVAAALGASFSMAIWMALFLHVVGLEIYLNLSLAEGEGPRNERQLEAGFKHPGSVGLIVDRWGDVPAWQPQGG
jgi:hypothetical protein